MREKRSIATRVFQIVFAGTTLVLLVLLLASFSALEILEDTFLQSMKDAEISYFNRYVDKTKPMRIQTDEILSVFRPHALEHEMELPLLFQGLPIPFEGEVEALGTEYMVVAYPVPEGVYFFSRKLAQFEMYEEKSFFLMSILSLLILALGLILAFISSRLIARPVEQISSDIRRIKTNGSPMRIQRSFQDKELEAVSDALNQLLEEVEGLMQRERSMIAMASHELRTPIAVILGAANVIENRNQLHENDKITLERIVNSATDMKQMIQTLLELVRMTKAPPTNERFYVKHLLDEIQQEYSFQNGIPNKRLHFQVADDTVQIQAPEMLVKMLLHNIINNALDYSDNDITLRVDEKHLELQDQGITDKCLIKDGSNGSTGLGLYIVSLICHYLQWRFDIQLNENTGTSVKVFFRE